ncbi:MAG TPA: archaeosine biosynthesis radical SAM protein RaSEA [Methanomicrobiales archaeon]|jgi:radical SAM enzyme (TIGR01210 family)|nr:archaeosine biosynthesis radical SAM protein RaSEA [Methanomicrobiales archaeon]
MVSRGPERPVAAWIDRERREDGIVPALTLILKSGGCGWNRCLMCGYRHFRYSCNASFLPGLIRGQLTWIRERFSAEDYAVVKIFTSGSLLDPAEVPPEVRREILRAFRGKAVVAETRPEFVTRATVEECLADLDGGSGPVSFTVAIGLETSDDGIREKCMAKGFSFEDFLAASRTARRAGAGVKAYLLQKPPYLTETEAVEDVVRSVREVRPHADAISLNPCTVQKGTEVEHLWRLGAYRPPYLWSVLLALSRAGVEITCDPVGGGTPRGPHNCPSCDGELVRGIRDYSLSGDRSLLDALLAIDCTCKKEWEFVLGAERPWAMPLTR